MLARIRYACAAHTHTHTHTHTRARAAGKVRLPRAGFSSHVVFIPVSVSWCNMVHVDPPILQRMRVALNLVNPAVFIKGVSKNRQWM